MTTTTLTKTKPQLHRSETLTSALADTMQPGVTVFLPHHEAGALCTALIRAGKPVRIAYATSTHSSVTYTRPRHPAPVCDLTARHPWWNRPLPRAAAAAAVALLLALLTTGCGGGGDLADEHAADEVDTHERRAPLPPPVCLPDPRACI